LIILIERLFALHDSLRVADVPHAFGGAIALAYCTNEPRGTRDLDVNIFVPAAEALDVLRHLPPEIEIDADAKQALLRDGQVRLWWLETPVDLFFNNLPFHEVVARGVVEVPLEGRTIPVLDGPSLIVFKAMFDRTKDWADIEEIVSWDAEVARKGLALLGDLVDQNEPIYLRLQGLIPQ
jgi:hypothetical protein